MNNLKVLIIDDSKTIRESLKKLLLSYGMRVSFIYDTESAEEGHNMLEEHSFDLIFVDYEMPEMSGLDWTMKVRKSYNKKQLPIILITGIASKNEIINMIRKGINNYIIKPFDRIQVEEKIRYTLGMPVITNSELEE